MLQGVLTLFFLENEEKIRLIYGSIKSLYVTKQKKPQTLKTP